MLAGVTQVNRVNAYVVPTSAYAQLCVPMRPTYASSIAFVSCVEAMPLGQHRSCKTRKLLSRLTQLQRSRHIVVASCPNKPWHRPILTSQACCRSPWNATVRDNCTRTQCRTTCAKGHRNLSWHQRTEYDSTCADTVPQSCTTIGLRTEML